MQSFAIAPAGLRSLWVLVPVGIIVVGVSAVLALSLLSSWTASFEVSPAGLRLRGDLYGRFIPMPELRPREAKRVDWSSDPDLAPRLRTFGTGLPGYQSGWFRLKNGDKALLYLTDRTRAIYIPTTRGHGLLLSPSDPDTFLSALRAASDSS
jgi:Bacterial PH domain